MEIKRRREQLKMTQSWLAKAIGVSTRTIQAWENEGTEPKPDKVEKLKEVLQLDQSNISN